MIDKSARYTESHEWAKLEDGVVTVGLSDPAYEQLGDIVFLELPEVGAAVTKGDSFGVIESVKAASDVYAPVSGEIVEVNKGAEDDVDNLAADAYGASWFIKIKVADSAEYDSLLNADKYAEIADTE